MTHLEAERDHLAERYVSRELPAQVESAFEEHYFTCDACFDAVQAAERFRSEIRRAASDGRLPAEPVTTAAPHPASWATWATLMPMAASLLLAVGAGWMATVQVPGLRRELDAERAVHANQARQLQEQAATVERVRQEQETAAAQQGPRPEANTPVAVLQTTRGADGAMRVTVPASASHVVLWFESAPSRIAAFRLTIAAADGKELVSLDGLTPNADGALSASIPSTGLQSGPVTARLYKSGGDDRRPVAQYRLDIVHTGR